MSAEYVDWQGRHADVQPITLAGRAARTVNGSGQALAVARGVARLTLDSSAYSGTATTLDVTVETSEAPPGPWRAVGAFPQQTAAGVVRRSFAGLDRHVRAAWTLGGTAAGVTFSVAGELAS